MSGTSAANSIASRAAGVEGVFAAAVTPRLPESGQADLGAALDLMEHFHGAGVNGVTLLGATGEFVHLDLEERSRLVSVLVSRSRLPVMVNVSHSSLDGAVRLARAAHQAGAAALLIMPPYYFRYEAEEIREFLARFAEQMPGDAALFLYNIPFFTSEIPAPVAEDLLSSGLYAGIKDSSGNWELMERLLALSRRAPFRLMVGNDSLFTRARTAGAHGSVSGVACAVPELLVGLDSSIGRGDQAKVERLEARLQEFIARIDAFPTPAGIREALQARGLKTGPAPVPLGPAGRAEAEAFREWFSSWLEEVRKEAAA